MSDDDTAWTEIGKALPPIKPEATSAERDRAIAHYERTLRPMLAPSVVVQPSETPEEKLDRLKRAVVPCARNPVVFGRELAQKLNLVLPAYGRDDEP